MALFVANSAFAFTASDIAGKWKSAPEGANQLTRAFQFGNQGEFTMQQSMQLENVEYSSVYRGTYVMVNDEIMATATSVEMTVQGQSRQVPLSPGSGVVIDVIQCSGEAITLQMGKENLFINLQRVH